MNKIATCLWFDTQAEEAVDYYVSVFEDAVVGKIAHYANAGKEVHGKEPGSVMTVEFKLFDHDFLALNGGPLFQFNPSISLTVNCSSAEEVDKYWQKLAADEHKVLMPLQEYPFSKRYGWIQDKYGLSWQINVAEGEVAQKLIPSLLFVDEVYHKAEEAINFYTSVFKDAELKSIFKYGVGQEPDDEDAVMYADFTLERQMFIAMDSAREHEFAFNEAVSFVVNCETQEEIDYYWEKLSAVPESEACGWLKDKYGVSWQITPTILEEFADQGEAAERMMAALMEMKKLDIADLTRAYNGE